MVMPARLRQQAKTAIRPLALPLLRRFRLPFEVMLPRIEQLEHRLAAIAPAPAAPPPSLAETSEALRGTVANLTRAWMRQQQELATLSATMERRLAAFEHRLADAGGARLAEAERRSAATEERLAALERQVQDDVAGRGKRVDETLRFLLDRVEFVRRELMFEMRYGAGSGGSGAPAASRPGAVAPRILEPEKVAAARAAGALRLNLGCGHIAVPGYANVDMRDLPGVDVVAEVGNLPFEPGTVDEIASAHLLEHFPQEDLRRRLLPYWRGLLKPGGTLRAVTPDGAAMLAGVADGSYGFADFRDVLFGGQDYDGDFHFNLLTPDSLRGLVEEAGFEAVEVPVQGRRNGQCFEFELVARAPMPRAAA